MVYRSSRRQASSEREPEGLSLQSDSDSFAAVEKGANLRRQVGLWRFAALCLTIVSVCLVIALIVVARKSSSASSGDVPTCGEDSGSDADSKIDMREPDNPGPFHDLTRKELEALRSFLENDKNIKAVKAEEAKLDSSAIFMMDLYQPKKSEVLKYLDGNGKQPIRQARVIMFRGDLKEPKSEEYICGPLPKVSNCSLLVSPTRRNPTEFSVRPFNPIEVDAMYQELFPRLDEKIGHILRESYGTSFGNNCGSRECFKFYPSPIGTNLLNDIKKRVLWLWAEYSVTYYGVRPAGFAFLADVSASDPKQWSILKAWYNNQLFHSLDDFVTQYDNNKIEKVKITYPEYRDDHYSSMKPREPLFPKEPQRPPTLVEPDGKRYTLKDRKVNYLEWSFNFRMSALTGPSLFDVRYKNERIAYEIGLAEIAVTYASNNPMHSVTNFVDSAVLIGSQSKSLIPGADCPESATFINLTFPGQVKSEPVEINRGLCLFENNNGYPLRRHLSYSSYEGGFYGGLQDTVLVLRSALTVVNYDYIVDFILHQNGVVETRIMSTGYIYPAAYYPSEDHYAFQIQKGIGGSIHHHFFNFKADVDIGGTSNRYETLDISAEEIQLKVEPNSKLHQARFDRRLKKTEKQALFKYDFDKPKYHVVHNIAKKTKFDEIKAYRIGLAGMSKQILPDNEGNEQTFSWARHQLVATKYKDEEVVSSSPYAMWDSANPVTNFTKFYADDENIVDEDIVFWITQGMHHIPHTEDFPVTPTVGNHLTFFLFPYNYFDECPSMHSRDMIHIGYKDESDPTKGVTVNRNGLSDKQCITPQKATAYQQLLEDDPDVAIESRKFRGLS